MSGNRVPDKRSVSGGKSTESDNRIGVSELPSIHLDAEPDEKGDLAYRVTTTGGLSPSQVVNILLDHAIYLAIRIGRIGALADIARAEGKAQDAAKEALKEIETKG
jgi:hypothetical protein